MPIDREEEYIARQEFERLRKIDEEKQQKLAEEEKLKLKELHQMRCPKCGMHLVAMDYKGIEVDKCSHCEGIWLDAGEMESVIDLEKNALDKFFKIFRK